MSKNTKITHKILNNFCKLNTKEIQKYVYLKLSNFLRKPSRNP